MARFARARRIHHTIPKPKKRKGSAAAQEQIVFDEGRGLWDEKQQYGTMSVINELRQVVDQWRDLPNPNQWQVTPATPRLLELAASFV